MFRKIDTKTISDITSEWDALASIRHFHITSGVDVTYRLILVPIILSLVSLESAASILDAGCGVGFLTSMLADYAEEVVGVDPSSASVTLARANYGKRANFVEATVERYSEQTAQRFDIVVANMVLMDILDLDNFLVAASRVLRTGGAFIFATTHPWFWPRYYGYVDEPWFRYSLELVIESPFKITAVPDCQLLSTHVHRPLEAYIEGFRKAGLSVETLHEPMPSAEIDALYPKPWDYPRYLVGLCRRQKGGSPSHAASSEA
jgi:SAM-dependent methyltransferase